MSFPFVASYVQGGTARGPRLAVVWHLAEGGGTVGFLAKQNPNGVSVHYVIEYSGRIVQMLRLDQMHTSIRSTDIRTTNDADGFYGVTAARAVMGDWANIRRTLGPNHASIAVELEGFAEDGPNAKQTAAVVQLYDYLQQAKYPAIRSLGHRDFTSRKACPGKRFPWDAAAGHGITEPEDDMIDFTLPQTEVAGQITVGPNGATVITIDGGERPKLPAGMRRPAIGGFPESDDQLTLGIRGDLAHYQIYVGNEIGFVAAPDVAFEPYLTFDFDTDCAVAISEAIAEDRARARITYS